MQHVTNTSRSDTVEMSPSSLTNSINEDCRSLQAKYDITGRFYDILDYPWERQYRRWRPGLLKDVRGKALEAGVGTGRNLKYYHPGVKLTAVDLSKVMLRRNNETGKIGCLQSRPLPGRCHGYEFYSFQPF
ncbi:class I SAM-dependent methyltransferase [candidate division KSB1 bacterium]|nr:class I SAM-dependent methyltransferase [candidate division KSB1 bacterium]